MTFASATARQVGLPRTTAGRANAAVAALGALAAALVLGGCIQVLQAPFGNQTEKAVSVTAVLFAAVLLAAPGIYILRARREARPETVCFALLATMAVLQLAIYFFWVRSYVFFPADIWTWSEGDYVNDMLKFSVGYPLYSAPANHDSYTYVPGSQLLTYCLAWLAGKAGSVPAYRVIQLCYTALAAFMAFLCCRRILRLSHPGSRAARGWLWNVLCYSGCLLMATNAITNRFAHNLHGDALAQLATMTAYYLLLVYMENRRRAVLVAMIALAPVGFLIKQNMLVWGVFYAGFLAIWGGSWKRVAVFAAATAALFAAILTACRLTWGPPFDYWIFYLLAHHPVSPLRSFQHVLDAWAYYAAGLVGGVIVLRGKRTDGLWGAWLIWLGLLTIEAYTSGIAWMLNHMGPGSLMAGIWFLAGLACLWDWWAERVPAGNAWAAENCIRAAAVTAVVALMFSGMGLIRIPLRPVSDDAYRYVRDIEKAFQGQPAGKVLLDVGSWVYIKDRVIMGDRAPCIGEEGYASTGDFSLFLSHLAAKRYSRILVRDLHEYDFWYENAQWPKPIGLRKALLDNYHEAGRIRAAAAPKDVKHWAEDPYLFDEITILEPNTDSVAGAN